MSSVAVIGCGLFGACIAFKLRECGHDVVVFERGPEAIVGASFNNQGRLHLGFHYPRDRRTVQQCIDGYQAFRRAFPDIIADDFLNAYFIASDQSRTSRSEYVRFCDEMGLAYRLIDPAAFDPQIVDVAMGLVTQEAVYDGPRLRKLVADRLAAANIDIRYDTEIVAARDHGRKIALHDAGGRREDFDALVNATYANASRIARSLGLPVLERQYEYVAVPLIKAPFDRVGITVMDGDFVTVLPYGSSGLHTLYHVRHSVLETSLSLDVDRDWLDQCRSPFSTCDATALFERVRSASLRFVPALADAELAGFLHGPRAVLARADASDARPSIVEHPTARYVGVFSGKVDHCIGVADLVAEKLAATL